MVQPTRILYVVVAAATFSAGSEQAHAQANEDNAAKPPLNTSDEAASSTAESSLAPAPTAADVANAPAPEEASGILVARKRDDSGLAAQRGVLFVPRVVLAVPLGLQRGAVYAFDAVDDRYIEWFFNDDETIGLYPTALFEVGFGLNVGARFVARELGKNRAAVHARVGYGGPTKYVAKADAATGRLLGDRFEIGLEVALRSHDRARYFGFGNSDVASVDEVGELIDPAVDDTAVATRFRHDDLRVEAVGEIKLSRRWVSRVSVAHTSRTFTDDVSLRGDANLVDVYDRSTLVGYDTDLQNIYGELELSYDVRRPVHLFNAASVPSSGWRVAGFSGVQRGLDNDPSKFFRWGLDVQRHFNLWLGDRLLLLRVFVEGVVGDYDDIPFLDMPKLGGYQLLRGYSRDRFAGRYAAIASAEYNYPVHKSMAAYLFADSGRTFRDVDDVELGGLRLGFGGGLQFHSERTFVARAFLASSVDGGLFFNFSFDPVFRVKARTKR